MIRAVIFDRDGVLADFDQERAAQLFTPLLQRDIAWLSGRLRRFVASVGEPVGANREKTFWPSFWDTVASELSLSREVRHTLSKIDLASLLSVYPDAPVALRAVKACGLLVGVLSNFSLFGLERSLQRLGLSVWVDAARSAVEIGAAKPDPRAYQAIADALGVPLSACLVLDDKPPLVEGARQAGARAVLVCRGEAPSVAHLTDLYQLPNYLASCLQEGLGV